MDMHTDTTAHLAAEGAEVPARAVADMVAAMAGPTDNPVSLAALLAKRNAMMDAINLRAEGDDAPDDEVTQANEAAFAIEQEILTTPCRTADDAVAKVAALVEFIRDAGCPDESDVENVLSDIGRILRESSYPMRATKVDRQDAHWALVPHALPAGPTDFTTRLDDLVAKAKVYSAEFVEPADKAHSAADHAKMQAPAEEKATLDGVVEAAWKTWEDHCSVYRSMVEPILALTPTTPEQLLLQVDAYAHLMAVHWARNPKADTPLGRLGEDEVDEIAEHMHASLKRLVGGEGGPIAPAPNGPVAPAPTSANIEPARAAIVAEAAEYAKLVRQAQDAFNEADEAWVKDKGDRTPGLAEQREALEATWADRLERHHDIAKRVLDLPASSPDEVAAHVATYAKIMAPLVCLPGETEVDDLPRENLMVIIDYLTNKAVVQAAVHQGDDSELDRLFAALDAAGKASVEACEVWSRARERYEELIGEPPAVLRKQGRDYAVGLPIGNSLASAFHDDLDAAREVRDRNAKVFNEHGMNKLSFERSQEVVKALEEREALMDAAFAQAGVEELHKATECAEDVEDDICAAIHHYRPRTLAGLQRKAAFIAARIGEEGGLSEWQAAWARTLVDDVREIAAA